MSTDRPSPADLLALGPTASAALWMERLQRDDAGADDAAFRQWLESSDANRAAWARASDLWDLFAEIDSDGSLDDIRQSALRLRGRRSAPTRRWALAAASVAVVALVVALAARFHLDGGSPSRGPTPPQIAHAPTPDLGRFGAPDYVTAVGRRLEVRLADGTRLELDTDTAVDVAYVDGLRLVRLLRGQAYFDVAHDGARPFRVAAGGRVITDLGTRFNMRLRDGALRVVLLEGSLGVTHGDDPQAEPAGPSQTLAPGQDLVVRAGRPDEIADADVDRVSDWRRGVIQFDNATLAEAVAEVDRYATTPIVIRDPKVGGLRVSGAFRTGETARFAETVAALHPVRLVQLPDGRVEIVAAP